MKPLLKSTIYVLLPSITLWWLLHSNPAQNVNRLNSTEVRQLQRYDESVQADVDAVWKRIEEQLDEHDWAKHVELNPPATLEQIEALEEELGYRLVADYKASLLVHNGSNGEFCSNYSLFSTEEILWFWRMYIGVYGEFAPHKIYPTPEKVMNHEWHPGWVPTACWDVYTTIVNVETGQVCYWDEFGASYDAASWTKWLNNVASRLESGEIRRESSTLGHWTAFDLNSPGSE